MKTRESGMPEESIWQGYFEPEAVLKKLGLTSACGNVVDFGCGYGTFTIPAARIASGIVYALDIEPGDSSAARRMSRMVRSGRLRVSIARSDRLAALPLRLRVSEADRATIGRVARRIDVLPRAGATAGLSGSAAWRFDWRHELRARASKDCPALPRSRACPRVDLFLQSSLAFAGQRCPAREIDNLLPARPQSRPRWEPNPRTSVSLV